MKVIKIRKADEVSEALISEIFSGLEDITEKGAAQEAVRDAVGAFFSGGGKELTREQIEQIAREAHTYIKEGGANIAQEHAKLLDMLNQGPAVGLVPSAANSTEQNSATSDPARTGKVAGLFKNFHNPVTVMKDLLKQGEDGKRQVGKFCLRGAGAVVGIGVAYKFAKNALQPTKLDPATGEEVQKSWVTRISNAVLALGAAVGAYASVAYTKGAPAR